MKYIGFLILLVILSACTSPTAVSTPTLPLPVLEPLPTTSAPPTPTAVPVRIKLLGYNYKIKDAGDGWNEGLVRLAFENISDEYIAGEKIDTSGAMLETQEGKTYPVTLYQATVRNTENQVKEIDFSSLTVIPPHFRWTRVGISGDIVKYNAKVGALDLGEGEYYLRFRPAVAAHPTRVVFPKYPDWKIDLAPAAQANPVFPADAAVLAPKPLSALASRVLAEDANGLRVTLDGVGTWTASTQDIQLKYTIVNKDKLDAHAAQATLPVRAFFFGDGAVKLGTIEITNRTVQAGPGQTKQATWSMGTLFMDKKCNPKVYALIQEASQYSVYNLSVCK